MTDILERAKAADIDTLACSDWSTLREIVQGLIAEVEAQRERAQFYYCEAYDLWLKKMDLQGGVERLRSENKIISDRAAHHDRQDAKEIELLAARIAELEAKQANNEYLQKMTEEAQGIMQESQLLLCKEANEAEQLQNEVERLRSVDICPFDDDLTCPLDYHTCEIYRERMEEEQ